jgi:hypothetical protein
MRHIPGHTGSAQAFVDRKERYSFAKLRVVY